MEQNTNNQPQTGRFIAGVSSLIWRPPDGKYLILRRSSEKDFGRGAWEGVSGRVDQGESFEQALRREIREELGVEVQVDFIIGTMHFYRGPADPSTELLGIEYCCSIQPGAEIRINAEHSEHHWVSPAEAKEALPQDHWLLKAIQRAETIRAFIPQELLDYNRKTGFEI